MYDLLQSGTALECIVTLLQRIHGDQHSGVILIAKLAG